MPSPLPITNGALTATIFWLVSWGENIVLDNITNSPRMKMDNGIKVFNYYGEKVYEETVDELYQVRLLILHIHNNR